MLRLYQYIRENETRFFFYSKLACTLLVAFLLISTFRFGSDINIKMMGSAFGLLLLSTIIWGFVFLHKVFDHQAAKIIALVDLAMIFLLIYPVHHANALFMVLPVIILISIVFLLSPKELNELLFSSMAIFIVATVIFSILNMINNPVQIFIAHALLYTAVYIASSMSIPVISVYESNQSKFHRDQVQLEKQYEQLQQDLSLSTEQIKSLTKDIRKKDNEIKNIVNLSGQLKINNDFKKILDSFILTLIGQVGCTHAWNIYTGKKGP